MSIPLYTLCFLDSIIKLWIFLLCIAMFKDFVVWPRSLHSGMFTPPLSPACCSSAILSDLLRRNTFQYLPVSPPSPCNFCNLFTSYRQNQPGITALWKRSPCILWKPNSKRGGRHKLKATWRKCYPVCVTAISSVWCARMVHQHR